MREGPISQSLYHPGLWQERLRLLSLLVVFLGVKTLGLLLSESSEGRRGKAESWVSVWLPRVNFALGCARKLVRFTDLDEVIRTWEALSHQGLEGPSR